jgi:hypothetical protein
VPPRKLPRASDSGHREKSKSGIGKLERVDLREVWRTEGAFTKWLEENIDVLSEALDLTLDSPKREKRAGTFSVDIVADDEQGKPVVIENQLTRSDHDHLGKLVTYLTALEAATAVWIVSDPRPEHTGAISRLNESPATSFYLVKLEALRIAGSPCAPLFTLIVGPSEEARRIGEAKQERSERHEKLRAFWTGLLERAKRSTTLHANVSPPDGAWVAAGAGMGGLSYSYVARKNDWHVELYIDCGKDSYDQNKALFDKLLRSRQPIENSFGDSLEWQRLEGRRACRVKTRSFPRSYRDEAQWPAMHESMVDVMVRFERALKPHIARLKG